jgi:hypothetical protein
MTPPTEQKNPRPHWREVKLHRVVLLFILIVGGIFVLRQAVGFANWFIQPYLIAGKFGMDKPFLERVPAPLNDTSIATLTGMSIQRYGCSFQVPWDSIEKQYSSDYVAVLRFSGGASLMLTSPDDPVLPFAEIAKKGPQEHAAMAALFGENAIRSDYDLVRAALYARPSDVRWWNSRSAHVRIFELMGQKGILLLTNSPTAHPLATASVRGFQFDAMDRGGVRLLLFDTKDRRYEIDLFDNGTLTQPQINAIVASFQPRP